MFNLSGEVCEIYGILFPLFAGFEPELKDGA